jgi:hypothetical protein
LGVAAHATYAISIGFKDLTEPDFTAGKYDLASFEGTAIAIDDRYLLTCAHLFEYDTTMRTNDPRNLEYVYVSLSISKLRF